MYTCVYIYIFGAFYRHSKDTAKHLELCRSQGNATSRCHCEVALRAQECVLFPLALMEGNRLEVGDEGEKRGQSPGVLCEVCGIVQGCCQQGKK